MLRTMISVFCLLWPLLACSDESPRPSEITPPAWKTFAAATKPIHSVFWTPDERHVMATSLDGICRVWLVETGDVVKEFPVNGSLAAILPDGERVLVASNDGKQIVLVRWSTGEIIQTLSKPRDLPLRSFSVSPQGDRIAAAEEKSGSCSIWDVATGKMLRTLTGHKGHLYGLCFSHDGKRLVTSSDDHLRILWDVESGKEAMRWSIPEFIVSSIDISSDGRYLVESGTSTEVIVREMATQKVVQVLRGHETDRISRCQFLKASPLVATSGLDKTVASGMSRVVVSCW